MGAEIVLVDLRGPSLEADCLDCLVALPSAIERMRQRMDEEDLPTHLIHATRLAFEALDTREGKGIVMVAASSQDLLHRDVVGLTTMDRYTRVYFVRFVRVVRDFSLQLSKQPVRTFYLLDNVNQRNIDPPPKQG